MSQSFQRPRTLIDDHTVHLLGYTTNHIKRVQSIHLDSIHPKSLDRLGILVASTRVWVEGGVGVKGVGRLGNMVSIHARPLITQVILDGRGVSEGRGAHGRWCRR